MNIFLDFDGVLRRSGSEPSCFETGLLDSFESTLRNQKMLNAKIIIASTWRLAMSLDEIRRLFSNDIRERIIGVTPELRMITNHQRYAEVISYLKKNNLTEKQWVSVDDDAELFPKNAPLFLIDPKTGFNEDYAKKFLMVFK